MPTHKTMVSDFIECKQNFKEMMQMIEESRKNTGLGKKIIKAAQKARVIREKERPKTNFMSKH